MADIALGSVGKIIDIALKIKEAVKNVKQNEKDCRDIERCVARVTALIKRLDEVTKAMKDDVMRDALEDLAESLEGALELVTKCQRKNVLRRFVGAGDMAKELRVVQDDILRKVTVGSFANVVQLTVMMTIAQAAPNPQTHRQDVAMENPLHGDHSTTDASARSEKGETKVPTGSGAPAGSASSEKGKTMVQTGSGAPADTLSAGLTKFSFSELEHATDNFSERNVIGRGGFAVVYKGILHKREVAIKKLSNISFDNHHEYGLFDAINVSVELNHKNIVKPLGYCHEDIMVSTSCEVNDIRDKQLFLVEEYMPNGSMENIIKGSQRIDWSSHFKIIEGIAQGLHYLHEQRVIHLDLKPANILLDSDMNPRICDFGVAKKLHRDKAGILRDINSIGGTWRYMAPEYISEGIMSVKSDVYAFGLTVLHAIDAAEVYMGGPSYNVFDWAFEFRDPVEMYQLLVRDESQKLQIKRCMNVGRMCVQRDMNDRPTMADVIALLSGERKFPMRPWL